MPTKICRECERRKPLTSFYKHAQMADGHLNKCKECVKTRVAGHRKENIDKINRYDRERGRTEARKADVRDRQKAGYSKVVRQASKSVSLYRDKNPDKVAAHRAVARAIKSGKLIRGGCEVCGTNQNIHGHHKDYTKKLDVTWLCASCHGKEHRVY